MWIVDGIKFWLLMLLFYDTCNGVIKYLLFALVGNKMLGVFFRCEIKLENGSRLETRDGRARNKRVIKIIRQLGELCGAWLSIQTVFTVYKKQNN